MTGTSYDANGNLLTGTFHTYIWDANWGNVASIDSTTLTFDALGRMVEQNKSGVYTQILYGPGGTKLALMNGLTTLVKAYIPLPGRTQAVYASTGLSYYRHPDWLGSSRFASTPSRTKSADGAYAPFGEPYGTGGGPPILAFSGQNQDTATGLYDFLYREYAPTQGRWISPDPTGLAAANPSNPQTWNRYVYVENTPLVTIDALGLCPFGRNGEYVCKPLCSDTHQICANQFMGFTDLQLQGIAAVPMDSTTRIGPNGQTQIWNPGTFQEGYWISQGSWEGSIATTPGGWSYVANDAAFLANAASVNAANNGNCQAPFLCNPTNTPVVQKTPTPPDTHTHSYSDYVACAFGTEINDMFGDKNKAATTVLINIAPLAPANYLKGGPIPYLVVAGVWDIGHALKARSECTASVYGR